MGIHRNDYFELLRSYATIRRAVEIFESENGKDAQVSMPIHMVEDFITNADQKSFKDYAVLRLYLAIKSKLGVKAFTDTNKPEMLSRMIGARSIEVKKYFLSQRSSKEKTNQMLKKYTGRYFFDQILLTVIAGRYIPTKITYGKSIYLSTTLSYAELAAKVSDVISNAINAKKSVKNDEKEAIKLLRSNLISR